MTLPDLVALSSLAGLSRQRLVAELLARRDPAQEPSFIELVRRTARQVPSPARLQEVRAQAQAQIAWARTRGIQALPLGSARYPARLAAIDVPPLVLWCRGRLEALLAPCAVALVGARAATQQAREVAGRLAEDLAECGILVVSGLARGIDVAAHEGALRSAAPLSTVGVLGTGVDITYPAEHEDVAGRIARRGALVSEFPPGTRPRPSHFPQRNRIISGLCQVVVIVEAAARSGALITADLALDQGREVLAVPGPVLSGRNEGGHALLRDGARLVEHVRDILEELDRLPGTSAAPPPAAEQRAPAAAGKQDGGPQPPDAEGAVLRCLSVGDPCTMGIDELVQATGLSVPEVQGQLLGLELTGRIRRQGGRFAAAPGRRRASPGGLDGSW